MTKQVIVKGHTLPFEGKTPDQWTGRNNHPVGSTKCSCGALSPILGSTYARQRWHRQHKLAVVDADG